MENIPAPSFSGRKSNADFCGSIPLNFLNLVQSHGVLLVLKHENFTIVQASENTEAVLDIAAEQLLQRSLEEFIDREQLQLLRAKLAQWGMHSYLPLTLQWQTGSGIKTFTATLHRKEAYLLLELEEMQQPAAVAFTNMYQEIAYAVSALKEASSLEELSRIATVELRNLSGFDRIMVYRFDTDWNGTVIAEAQAPDMADSYLGLHFPASDVPRQARELYTKTPYRIIANAEAPAAKLYPVLNPLTGGLTDISSCVLRAVPLVHLEYLHNMGVRTSMSTPIIVGNQLWGLISCHHRQPKQLSFEARASFEIISGIIAAQISSQEKEESFRYRARLHKAELKLLEQLYSKKQLEEGLLNNPAYLLDLLEVTGIALVTPATYETAGEVPPERMVRNLIKWLSRYNKEKIFTTDSLPQLFSDAMKCRDIASGLIAVQITGSKQYLLGFRPEVIKSVNWGGNPNEAIKFEPDRKQYHPRNSFKLWKERVEYTSEPWLPEVLEAVQHLRTAILEKLLKEEDSF